MSENPSPTPAKARQVRAEAGDAGQRLDNFLLRRLKGAPKSLIYRIVRRGEVRVNGGRCKASQRVAAGDWIRIPPVRLGAAAQAAPPRLDAALAERLEAAVLHEDKQLLILDKPSGLAVHGGSGISLGVIEGLRQIRPECKELELVHRLDRDTSGCLVLAKRRSALRRLHELIRDNRIEKRYQALVSGVWAKNGAVCKASLLKNTLQSGERVVRVSPAGKSAETRFRVLRRLPAATLLEARLITGRTHQIRVHAAHLGTPILGDAKYGREADNRRARELGLRRLFLHAESLRFAWEDGMLEIRAPLGPELQRALAALAEETSE